MTAPAAPSRSAPPAIPDVQRAARLTSPGDARLERVPVPTPGAGQVLVRLEGSGVCASNLPVWEGRPWFEYPLEPGAPGHEGWGRIAALGDGVGDLQVGQRVSLVSGHAYAEWDVADAAGVVPTPAELEGSPFPGEPLGCAMNAFSRAGVRAGDDVAVVGVGFLGALLVRLASDAGARVIAVSRRPFSLDVARQCGAAETVPLGEPWQVEEAVKGLTGGCGCDVVIECVGLQGALDAATKLTRERGRLVIAGYHQDGLRTVDVQLWNWRGLDVINAHERDVAVYADGMRRAMDAAASGRLPLDLLLTHRYPLGELGAALEATAERPDGFLKALVIT